MDKPVLIIVGQTPPPHNGQAKMIALLIAGLADHFDVHQVRMAFSDTVDQAGRVGFKKVHHLFSLIRETRRLLQAYPNAMLYYPPASPNWVPVLRDILFLSAVRPLARKTIFHFHAGGLAAWLRRHRWMGLISRFAYRYPDLAVQLGPSCPADGPGLGARKTVLVPYGLNLHVSIPPPRTEGLLRVLYVGIHTEAKGLFDLLETARLLKQRGIPFEIKTVGRWYGQQERKKFEQMRQRYALEDGVQSVGEKTGDELWSLYAWSDVFFFPTHYPWETFGIVQLEAMAHGLPIVATDWPGPRDVVEDGVTGYLSAPGDIAAMAAALQKLAADPDLREHLGQAGRKRYEENFTAERFVEKMAHQFLTSLKT